MSDDDTIAEEIRRRRHAKAERRSSAARRKENRPRRDDLARAAYYTLLITIQKAEQREDAAFAGRIRDAILNTMERAHFNRSIVALELDDHIETVTGDLRAWIAARRIALEKAAEAAEQSAADT